MAPAALRSGPISSPRPFSRAAARAAASVTRTSSKARFRSMASQRFGARPRKSNTHCLEHSVQVGGHAQRLGTGLDGVVGILEAVARKRADYHGARLDA